MCRDENDVDALRRSVRNACEHTFVHRDAIRRQAEGLIASGLTDADVAQRLGIPRTTVRDWRRPRYVRHSVDARCHRCWRLTRPMRFTRTDYAELLGLYLGDGHITAAGRTQRLRIFLDARYAKVVDETEALLKRCLPRNRVARGRA